MAVSTQSGNLEAARFAARQPILTANQKVIGYKLFLRTPGKQTLDLEPPAAQINALIDVSSLLGINTLCDHRLAFISCSQQALLEGHLNLLPPELTVAELPPDVQPSAAIIEACHNLKQSGYRIALEHVTLEDPRASLFELCDFFKVNMHQLPAPQRDALTNFHRPRRSRLLADHVETWEDFQAARESGFHYFQGFFFRRSETLTTRPMGPSRLIALQLLKIIGQLDLDWKEVEDLLKRDATLYYRLLRYINSAAFGLRSEVRSVSQALNILGEDQFRRWCRLSILLDTAQNRPSDLALSTLLRARFAELIGLKLGIDNADTFLLGLLSLMDAVLEMPMSSVLDGIHLDPAITAALLEHQGPLATLYDLILAVDAGMWGAIVRICERLSLDEEFVAQATIEAMEWAQSITSTADSTP